MTLARRRSPPHYYSPSRIPTVEERHEFNTHWFAGPLYERLDALLVTSALSVGRPGDDDPLPFLGAFNGVRVAPFVWGFRRFPLQARSAQPAPAAPEPTPEYRQVVRTTKPEQPTDDQRVFTCCWCQHFLMVDARLVVAWPCYVRCANCRRLCVWHEQHYRSLRRGD